MTPKDSKKKPGGTAVRGDDGRDHGFPSADPVTSLRIVGRDVELKLSPEKHSFTLGSALPPEVDLTVTSPRPPEHVSRVHVQIKRKGNRLWILDHESTNGIFYRDRRETAFEIIAGDSFRVVDIRLLALDEYLALLRPQLSWTLGLEAHAAVDTALELIARGSHILLVGKPGCDQLDLARQIHATSARRLRSFVEVPPSVLASTELGAALATATRGTAFVDLHAATRPSPVASVTQLFGEQHQIRTIVSAASVEQAQQRLGGLSSAQLQVITIPPLAKRREDIPRLLDTLLAREGSVRRVGELGASRVAALEAHDWPHNFDDLRRNVKRILALIEHKSARAAARALGISESSLREWIGRLGL